MLSGLSHSWQGLSAHGLERREGYTQVKKIWQQRRWHEAQVVQFLRPPKRETSIASTLFSLSFSLNHPPLEGIRVRSQPTIEPERRQRSTDPRLRRRQRLELSVSLCSIRPSVHPAFSSLQPPCSEPLSPSSHVQPAAKGAWRLAATAGLNEAGIIPLPVTLHRCSVHAAWESRACAPSHQPTTQHRASRGGIPEPWPCCRLLQQTKYFWPCFWPCRPFFFGLSLVRLASFCLPLIRASASQSTSRKHARPFRNSSRQ